MNFSAIVNLEKRVIRKRYNNKLMYSSNYPGTCKHSCQHFKIPISNKTDRELLSFPIARLHSGGRHDETVGSSLVPVYYPSLHRINWYPDKQGNRYYANLTSIILFGNSELIYYCTTTRTKIFGMGTDSDF